MDRLRKGARLHPRHTSREHRAPGLSVAKRCASVPGWPPTPRRAPGHKRRSMLNPLGHLVLHRKGSPRSGHSRLQLIPEYRLRAMVGFAQRRSPRWPEIRQSKAPPRPIPDSCGTHWSRVRSGPQTVFGAGGASRVGAARHHRGWRFGGVRPRLRVIVVTESAELRTWGTTTMH